MGKGRVTLDIGPKWMMNSEDSCRQRNRYQVISIGTSTLEGEKSLDIIIKIFAAEFVGKKSQSTCSPQRLKDAYIDINFVDQGDAPDASIIAFAWRTCDTLEHLKQPVDATHLDINSCGAGGGIMDRVTKRDKHSH